MKTVSEQLRAIIDKQGYYHVAKAAGVDKSQLFRFMHGRARLTTDSLDRVGNALGLKLTATKNVEGTKG